MAKYKSMYKYELADAAGVSSQTFRRWLIADRDVLSAMGISVKQKQLPHPKRHLYLFDAFVRISGSSGYQSFITYEQKGHNLKRVPLWGTGGQHAGWTITLHSMV